MAAPFHAPGPRSIYGLLPESLLRQVNYLFDVIISIGMRGAPAEQSPSRGHFRVPSRKRDALIWRRQIFLPLQRTTRGVSKKFGATLSLSGVDKLKQPLLSLNALTLGHHPINLGMKRRHAGAAMAMLTGRRLPCHFRFVPAR